MYKLVILNVKKNNNQKKSETELTASVLKKRSTTHKRLKERFLIRRIRLLSCFVLLKSVFLISCVFWILNVQFSAVQFEMSARLGKIICASNRLSEVFPCSLSNRSFPCWVNDDGPFSRLINGGRRELRLSTPLSSKRSMV